MSDIVSFCREHAGSYGDLRRYCETPIALDRAADEIERLRAEMAARDAALVRIGDLFGDAVQADCENGVKWLNERAAAQYLSDAPATLAAIREAQSIIEDQTDG